MSRRFPLVLSAALLLIGAAGASAQGIYSGQQSGDRFGAAARAAGDLNGDGLLDLVVGAPENDTGASNRGRAYIFFGRVQNAPAAPDLELATGASGDNFGAAVAGIGRFNSDGYDDLAIGAPYNDEGGSDRGKVYIYFGGSSMNTTADVILTGVQAGDHFGAALDGGVDFNGDTYDDLAVGAPDRPSSGALSGEVRIFLGGSSPSTTAAVILPGEMGNDAFGTSVRRAGDVNGDGFGDFIVGAPQPFALNPGRAYVIFGRSGSATPARLTLIGLVGGDRFGWAVGGGGDVNHDGFTDVVVGAPRHDDGATQNGAVYLFLGGSSMNATSDAKVVGRAAGDELGSSVSIIGDYDGDNRSDLVAGAPGSDTQGSRSGEIDLWRGGTPLNTASRDVLSGPELVSGSAAGDEYGSAVDMADYNGDGQWEILGGAPLANQTGGDEVGLASLLFFPGTFVPVALLDLSIHPGGDRVKVEWRVEDDGTLLGFHVERRAAGAAWIRRTVELLHGLDGRFRFEDVDPELLAGGTFEYRLLGVLRGGGTDTFGPYTFVNAPSVQPWLGAGYPNPSPNGVRIPVVLPEAGPISLDVFDATGRQVRRLWDGAMAAGRTELWWDGHDDRGQRLPAGTYFYRMETPFGVRARSVIVLR